MPWLIRLVLSLLFLISPAAFSQSENFEPKPESESSSNLNPECIKLMSGFKTKTEFQKDFIKKRNQIFKSYLDLLSSINDGVKNIQDTILESQGVVLYKLVKSFFEQVYFNPDSFERNFNFDLDSVDFSTQKGKKEFVNFFSQAVEEISTSLSIWMSSSSSKNNIVEHLSKIELLLSQLIDRTNNSDSKLSFKEIRDAINSFCQYHIQLTTVSDQISRGTIRYNLGSFVTVSKIKENLLSSLGTVNLETIDDYLDSYLGIDLIRPLLYFIMEELNSILMNQIDQMNELDFIRLLVTDTNLLKKYSSDDTTKKYFELGRISYLAKDKSISIDDDKNSLVFKLHYLLEEHGPSIINEISKKLNYSVAGSIRLFNAIFQPETPEDDSNFGICFSDIYRYIKKNFDKFESLNKKLDTKSFKDNSILSFDSHPLQFISLVLAVKVWDKLNQNSSPKNFKDDIKQFSVSFSQLSLVEKASLLWILSYDSGVKQDFTYALVGLSVIKDSDLEKSAKEGSLIDIISRSTIGSMLLELHDNHSLETVFPSYILDLHSKLIPLFNRINRYYMLVFYADQKNLPEFLELREDNSSTLDISESLDNSDSSDSL